MTTRQGISFLSIPYHQLDGLNNTNVFMLHLNSLEIQPGSHWTNRNASAGLCFQHLSSAPLSFPTSRSRLHSLACCPHLHLQKPAMLHLSPFSGVILLLPSSSSFEEYGDYTGSTWVI